MDQKTIESYDMNAEEIAKLHRELAPVRLYELTQKYFDKTGKTLDLGSGIGRDTEWFCEQGYDVLGIDASEGMLAVAREHYPHLKFEKDFLPQLATLSDESFQNIFCSAVLMHLPQDQIASAIENMLRVTKPSGRIIISIRAGGADQERENGKLYTTIIPEFLENYAKEFGGKLLLSVENFESDRGITWDSFVFEKKK